MAITWIGSSNKTKGRGGLRPEAVVVHIMDDDIVTVDRWFNTPKGPNNPMPVSAHYGVSRLGAIHQYVDEMDTAWHAGRVKGCVWPLLKTGAQSNPNRYTIGIEHEGKPDMPWTDEMYAASATLLAEISQRWSIALDRLHVIGHGEIYSAKPYCPGPHCELDHLIDLAHHVVLSGTSANTVERVGTVATTRDLNVRLGAPSSLAARVRLVRKGTTLTYTGWTSNGETVHGNAHWYRDRDGNFVWAGGTSQPVPA
jgi:N-acetyl-anhydromuramyl-L-alanine amidase AmpD